MLFYLQANGVTSNIEDVITKNAIQDIAPNTKTEAGKRRKGKKEKKETVIMAENVPGHMGQLSVEQLVHLIEGSNSEQNVKKQGPKDKSSASVEVLSEETSQTKKERRRKSKEAKETTTTTSPSLVTIGAQQTKTGGSAAAAATATTTTVTVSPPASVLTAHSPKMDFNLASNEVSSTEQEKQTSKVSAERTARSLTEDGEEEYLSADEGVPSSVGDETCLPPTVITSSTTIASSSTVSSTSEVVLDGRNYRADDEDVTQIERQCADEQEFITVNTKKKKVIEPAGKQQQQRTGSAGKNERYQRVFDRVESNRRSSVGVAPEMRSASSLGSTGQYGRRPTTALLADFIDDKEGGKVLSKSVVPVTFKNTKKPLRNERISQAEGEVSMSDSSMKQMSKPASSTTCDSPERTFSYADAAKKSSEPSRDNSPACVIAASPSSKSESPAPKTPTPVLCSRLEANNTEVLPCASVPAAASAAADGLSFFYDETEATTQYEEPYDAAKGTTPDRTFVLNLGGKTVRFAKGMASSATDTPPSNSHHMCMVEMLTQRWKMFQEGNVPKIYQPRIVSS